MSLLGRFAAGDRVALARLISYVENRGENYHEILAKIFSASKGAYRIGLTGPPGAGKSSLVNRLAGELADLGLRIGIIAVDPSSPFSGGALLGDRVRMQAVYGRPNVFVRSMATRGSSGGLAAATKDVCVLLEGFGFDYIMVETVGVGQVELDVASICDTVVVVLVPESGDAIQAMKSGLMEIADVFCLNKADRPGADRIHAEMQSILEVQQQIRQAAHARKSPDAPQWDPPVVQTIATRASGTERLWSTILKHREFHAQVDPAGHRRARARSDLVLGLTELARERLHERMFETPLLNEAVDRIINGNADPYTISRELYDNWCRQQS